MYTTILVACISAVVAIAIYAVITNFVVKNTIRKRRDAGGVIGFHMRDDKIIGRLAVECVLDILQPLCDLRLVHGIHDGDLVVEDDVGIVAHPVGDDILPFEEVDGGVVDADVCYVLKIFHLYLRKKRIFSFIALTTH